MMEAEAGKALTRRSATAKINHHATGKIKEWPFAPLIAATRNKKIFHLSGNLLLLTTWRGWRRQKSCLALAGWS